LVEIGHGLSSFTLGLSTRRYHPLVAPPMTVVPGARGTAPAWPR
jgi:hypothetical protein